MSNLRDICPYVGIEPFAEADRDFFFGREREIRVIISNLFAAPLTVLYGASGVGKTSVLLAGVVPKLHDEPRTAVVVFRHWQDETFAELLKTECLAAVEAALQTSLDVDRNLPFDQFLVVVTKRFQGTLLIIFDQFEEYFLYHPTPASQKSFEAEFARAVNREEIDANFLLALREDGLAKLDRFKARIPALLSNLLPLHRMDLQAAEEAIRKPLLAYNERLAEKEVAVSIEDSLVSALLEQVRTGQVQVSDTAGSGVAKSSKLNDQIEAPFLQLVMTRLWEREQQADSRILRRDTLVQLGGAQTIVHSHLDNLMRRLTVPERTLCARIFDRLVTPSGSKIAIKDKDLGNYAGDLAALLPTVLQKLSAFDARVLRCLPVPGTAGEQRYEIYHDVLAGAILDWRSRFVDAVEEAGRRRQRRLRLSVAGSVMLVTIVFFAFKSYYAWKEVRPWGALNNLTTGSIHVLKDATVSIGRNANALQYNNTVKLAPNMISRIHFLLNKELKGIDMRSLNGTTVNRDFLSYGDTAELDDGDIIVLADIAPFQFHKISYTPYQFWDSAVPPGERPPAGAWGLFIDLDRKRVFYLTENKYYLIAPSENNMSLSRDQVENWICSFGINTAGYAVIEDRRDSIDLYAEIKTGPTYDYRKGLVPPGNTYYYFSWQELGWNLVRSNDQADELEISSKLIYRAVFQTSSNRHFRILKIIPDLEQ